MITPEEIGYENELQENISIEDIRKEYKDGIIIWISGSGSSPEGKAGSYRCVLDYMGHVKYIEKQLSEETANQAMLIGAIDAVQCVNKPLRLYLISPTALGFISGFKGKGANSQLIQQLCKNVKEKKCQLTEVQFINGGDAMKKFVYSCNPDKSKGNPWEKQQEEKKRYKDIIYSECLMKVIRVLVENGVDERTIEAVREIKP